MQIHRIFSATKKRQKSKHSRHFLAYSIQSFFFFYLHRRELPSLLYLTPSVQFKHCVPRRIHRLIPTDSHTSLWNYFWANLCPCCWHVLHVPRLPVYQRGRTWNVCLWLCACVECTWEVELPELLSELITKTASNDGTKKLSMDSLSWLDSLSQLQNRLPPLW